VTTSGAGTFTVRLDVTDDGGGPAASTTLTVSAATPVANPPSNSGGDDGGGSMSWPWMLALGIAVTALRPRRR
jgi:MYXO-CTERM domain-containing protein